MQIQGQQGQAVGQLLQVASPSQQDIQGISTAAQLVQQGELTEEQHQQVAQMGSQVAERLGNRASNQKVAGSILGCAK